MPFIVGTTVDWYADPRIVSFPLSIDEVVLQDVHDTLRELEERLENMGFPKLIDSAGKEELGGGVLVGITSELQNAVLEFTPRTTPTQSGTATASASQTLTDTSATFITNGITYGDILINFTDKSMAMITEVVSETELNIRPLTGGSSNTITIGDSYAVYDVEQTEIAGGNLVAVDEFGANISPIAPSFGTQVVKTSSSSATIAEIQENTYNSAGGIHVDPATPYTGTSFPNGIPTRKVNNLADAKVIADLYGLQKFFIYGDVILDQSYPNWIFEGAVSLPIVTGNNQNVEGVLFKGVTVTGTVQGSATYADSTIIDLTGLDGFCRNTGFRGDNLMANGGSLLMNQCFSKVPGTDVPSISFSNAEANIRAYSGGIRVKNMDTALRDVGIDLVTGKIVVDSSCTESNLVCRGVGTIDDQSNGTIVNIDGLVSVRDYGEDGIHISDVQASTGTLFPVGSTSLRVNNINDAKIIADREGIKRYFYHKNLSLHESHNGFEFIGVGDFPEIDVNSQSITGVIFNRATVTGDCGGGSFKGGDQTVLKELTDIQGTFENCGMRGTLLLEDGTGSTFHNCYSIPAGNNPVILDFGVASVTGAEVNLVAFSGYVEIRNFNNAGKSITIDLIAGDVTIDSSCTAGTIVIHGTGIVNDQSNGSLVNVDGLIEGREFPQAGVFIDPDGSSGTQYPAGTLTSPVDNITDARAIADRESLYTFRFDSTLTIDQTYVQWDFEGRGAGAFVDLNNKIMTNSVFRTCYVTGDLALAGGPIYGGNECRLGNVTNIYGQFNQTGILGTIHVADGQDFDLHEAYTSTPASVPIIDFGATSATGSNMNMTSFSGRLIVRNFNNVGKSFNIELVSGEVIIESSCTAGEIFVRGVGLVDDQSAGSTVDTSALTNNLALQDIQFLSYYSDSVWVDVTTANTGTEHPTGTTREPVNNFTDAQTIADSRGLFNITTRGPSTISGSTHTSMKFWGRSPRTTQLTIDASANLTGCEFQELLLSGDLGSNGSAYFTTVAFKNTSGIFGHCESCILREGTNTVASGGLIMLNKCAGVSAVNPGTDIPILDCNGSGRVAMRNFSGECKITNKTSGNNCSLDLNNARVELDSTITFGNWRVFGVGSVIDNTTGSAVVDTTDLVDPSDVETAAKILKNRTETNPATGVMTVYDDDDVSTFLTANIYEDTGGATPYDENSTRIDRRDKLQ